jgi:hypothetical protein
MQRCPKQRQFEISYSPLAVYGKSFREIVRSISKAGKHIAVEIVEIEQLGLHRE